jgi:hypothetical protein
VKGVVLVALVVLGTVPSLALAGPTDPTARHNAADMRLARSIALTRADLAAGWAEEKGNGGASSDADCSAYPDESKLIQTGSVDPTFDSPRGGAASVDSEVDVYETTAMALVDWRNVNLRRLRTCITELLVKMTGVKVTITAAAKPVPVHAERTLAFSFELTGKGAVPYDIDVVALGKGRTSVLLSAAGPKGSYDRSLLTPLARLLAQRHAARIS